MLRTIRQFACLSLIALFGAGIAYGLKGQPETVAQAAPSIPVAASPAKPVEIPNSVIAEKDKVIADLRKQLEERKRAANHWYAVAMQHAAAKPKAKSGHYETRCSGRKCHQVWVED